MSCLFSTLYSDNNMEENMIKFSVSQWDFCAIYHQSKSHFVSQSLIFSCLSISKQCFAWKLIFVNTSSSLMTGTSF